MHNLYVRHVAGSPKNQFKTKKVKDCSPQNLCAILKELYCKAQSYVEALMTKNFSSLSRFCGSYKQLF